MPDIVNPRIEEYLRALYDDGDGIIWPGLHMSEYFDLDLRVIDTTTVGASSRARVTSAR